MAVTKRVYQVWKGSNRFFFGGRLIFGPDVGSLFLSTFLIAGPSIVFCSQVATRMMLQSWSLGLSVMIIAAFLTLWDLLLLFLTSGRDPGIVPRNSRPPEIEEGLDNVTPSMEWVNGATPHLRIPRMKDVVVNNVTVKVKYCDTCMLYRPPRASHCSICNNCVQRFDHHCPWVGQCIGLRNYRFFFLFISSSTFLCIYIFTFSWVNILIRKSGNNLGHVMAKEVPSLVLIGYSFIAVWFVGGLTVFHSYLISTNQTTYENFRYRYDKKENPYNRGPFKNFRELFLSPIPHSWNDFRAFAVEEPIELIPASPAMRCDMASTKVKIDIGMGSNKVELVGNPGVPQILQGLDYSGLEDNLKSRDFDANPLNAPFPLPLEDNLQAVQVNAGAVPNIHHGIEIPQQ